MHLINQEILYGSFNFTHFILLSDNIFECCKISSLSKLINLIILNNLLAVKNYYYRIKNNFLR